MDVHFEDFRANPHTVEVGADETVEDMRRKVASAVGLPEDSFCMSFGDEAMGEGYDMTQLSAGDTIALIKTKKTGSDEPATARRPIPVDVGAGVGHDDATREQFGGLHPPEKEVAVWTCAAAGVCLLAGWFTMERRSWT